MNLEQLRKSFEDRLNRIQNPRDLDEVRNEFLGRKRGVITALLKEVPSLPAEERSAAGKQINELKGEIEAALERKAVSLSKPVQQQVLDWSLPGTDYRFGATHPISIVRIRIEEIFQQMGYAIADGPEIETDFYNFGALNFPPDHPARDTQDTLFIRQGSSKEPLLLRTHTSPVQIRTMLSYQPPVRILCPGRVYRKDEIDASHSPIFHQMEALAVDEKITFADLKGTLLYFLQELFATDVKLRFRPSFFPFTEPSAEVDVSCVICGGKGCNVCKQSGWLEILGSGMVHPNVLEAVGYDSERYTGFAFGLGMERVALLMFSIPDIRLLYQNDMRFLAQFRVVP